MDLKKPFRIPVSAIVLDITGAVLLVLGILDLTGFRISFLDLFSGDPMKGWILVVFGAVFMTAATLLIIGLLLAKRRGSETSSTADHQH